MKLLRNLILIIFISIINVLVWIHCFAWLWELPPTYQDSNFWYNYNSGWQNDASTDIWSMIKHEVVKDETESWNAFPALLKLFQLSQQDWYIQPGEWKAIYYIKWIVNMWLWLTAFISLIMVIFAFYMIFFMKDEAWVSKAKQILKWVALALVVMWLSRFIVSLFFRVERWTTSENISSTIIHNNYTHTV